MSGLRLPDAIVVGAPKCGTTTLCGALALHPGVFMYPRKEIHFFNHHYGRGLGWYGSLFRAAPPGAVVMEGTPDYAMAGHAAEALPRIAGDLPGVRLVYMARDPIARIESHYVQMVANGRRALPLGEALDRWPEVVDTSRYATILGEMAVHVGRERIWVTTLEDYAADPMAVHAGVLRFLGLPADAEALAAMAAQPAAHRRADQGRDGRLLAALRRSRWYDGANRLVPRPLVRLGKRVLRGPVEVEAHWPRGLRERLSAELAGEWAAIRAEAARDAARA